jgi:DtxR family Mn-dependent transcriptional regulator
LTQKGRARALRIIRRHRLWELFLVEVLKYDWDEIDEEAERLEHIMSERLEQRIDEILGYPSHDPHGHAIPTSEGMVAEDKHVLLSKATSGDTVVVRSVNDANADLLKYASRLGISLGARIKVLEKIPFDGTLLVKVGRAEHYVSEKLSQHVFVEHAGRR